MLDASYFTDVKGAVYFPSRAYNAWQTWNELDIREIDRDFSYAQAAGINALRMFVSFEYWQQRPDAFFDRFEQVIAASQRHGIRIMPVLFEDCGADNTEETRANKDPRTAICVCSPCRAIQHDPARWVEVHGFVDAFMRRYGSDGRLLAIECMNEPHWESGNVAFAQHIVRLAKSYRGAVPLTIGCISLWHNLYFGDDLDVYQYHDNFPQSADSLAWMMNEAKQVQELLQKPCWLTEWQRVRENGPGWDKAVIPEEYKAPKLASLAPMIYGTHMGNFFWSLMVKPAYLMAQRPNGTFNGLFHEDGSVYSLADFQAVAGPDQTRPVKAELPDWYRQSLQACDP
ncbi:MAG: cellulase family glycosylhydrolase [Clostridia bacterium]|nr:cellulase family glycosylhydrolase [Clostridia bacterium]